jgi:hypothetical protein
MRSPAPLLLTLLFGLACAPSPAAPPATAGKPLSIACDGGLEITYSRLDPKVSRWRTLEVRCDGDRVSAWTFVHDPHAELEGPIDLRREAFDTAWRDAIEEIREHGCAHVRTKATQTEVTLKSIAANRGFECFDLDRRWTAILTRLEEEGWPVHLAEKIQAAGLLDD